MITLGMAELVFAMSLMFSEFFGGEAGVSANRVAGQAFLGITYGPQRQVYYLIAATPSCVWRSCTPSRKPRWAAS
jgi:branched-chain amino acid transport system permease protein